MLHFCLLHEVMYNYNKTQGSPYEPTMLENHSILRPENDLISGCGHIFNKMVPCDDNVPLIDEKNIVTHVYFEGDISFYTESPIKNQKSNRQSKKIYICCRKLKCIPSNGQHNSFFDQEKTRNIFLHP